MRRHSVWIGWSIMTHSMRTLPSFLASSIVIVLGVPATMYAQNTLASIPQQHRDRARNLLSSPAAKYLSGTGVNALTLVSNEGLARSPQRGNSDPHSPAADRFGIMVNDPAKDVFADAGVSTQSETALAAYGKNIVVAYNNSRAFGDPSGRSLQGYSLSRDGGASFVDIDLFPTRPTGFNFGDPGLVVDRSGAFYVSSLEQRVLALRISLDNRTGFIDAAQRR
jgi:hypothetical protein